MENAKARKKAAVQKNKQLKREHAHNKSKIKLMERRFNEAGIKVPAKGHSLMYGGLRDTTTQGYKDQNRDLQKN